MRIMLTDAYDLTPIVVEARTICWIPDEDHEEGWDASLADGVLRIETTNEMIWEARSGLFSDGGYERYMMEALTQGYTDLTKIAISKLLEDFDQEEE